MKVTNKMVCSCLVLALFPLIGMESSPSIFSFFLSGRRSFYSLVSAEILDNTVFLDREYLKTHFGDINVRNNGMTALHKLILRPDAQVEHLKALIECGANPDIFCMSYSLSGHLYEENTYTRGIAFMQSPLSGVDCQYFGNKEVMGYLLSVMVGRKLRKLIEQKTDTLDLFFHHGAIEFSFKPPVDIQYDWKTPTDEQARKLFFIR